MLQHDHKSNRFVLLFEFGLGGEVDGDRLGYRPGCEHNADAPAMRDHLPLVKKLGLASGFRHWVHDPDLQAIREGLRMGLPGAMIDVWNPTAYALAAARRGKKPRAYLDAMVDYCRRLVKRHGDLIWVNTLPEYDNDQWSHYAGRPAGRAAALERLRSLYLDNHGLNMFLFPDAPDEKPLPKNIDQAACRDVLLERLSRRNEKFRSPFNYLKERGIRPEEINLTALYCQTFSPHLLFELGARAVWPEGNVGNNHQVTIAFARGAARQYGREWCYDVAPFDCHAVTLPMGYDTRRRRVSGFTENYMLRAWLIAFLSGPKTFLLQASEMGFFTRLKTGRLELSPLGETGRDFADFCLRRHPDRGRTRAPIALLLARDHGYTTPYRNTPRLFGGCLPDDRANRSIEGFFRLAFPGFHLVHGTGCVDRSLWAPNGSYAQQFPWLRPGMTKLEDYAQIFRASIRDGKFDNRPNESAMLANATWGDSFDVLTENAPLRALLRYPAIILLGSIRLDGKLREKMRAYVKAGGRVMLNAAQASVEDAAWLGVEWAGMKEQKGHAHSLLTGRLFSEGLYQYRQVKPLQGAEILIEAGFLRRGPAAGGHGDPLLIRRRDGKGEIWFVTAPDCLPDPEKMDLTWMEACKEAADEFIRPHLALEIDGPPLQWLVNDTPAGIWIWLSNNSPDIWTGRVTVKDKMGRAAVRDIWNEKAFPFEYDAAGRTVLKPELGPWEFRLLEIRKGA